MYLLIFVRLQAERGISFVKGSLAFMTGVHSKVATIMKETELGTRCGRRTMYVSCRFIASGSISVMRYNNNNPGTFYVNTRVSTMTCCSNSVSTYHIGYSIMQFQEVYVVLVVLAGYSVCSCMVHRVV